MININWDYQPNTVRPDTVKRDKVKADKSNDPCRTDKEKQNRISVKSTR